MLVFIGEGAAEFGDCGRDGWLGGGDSRGVQVDFIDYSEHHDFEREGGAGAGISRHERIQNNWVRLARLTWKKLGYCEHVIGEGTKWELSHVGGGFAGLVLIGNDYFTGNADHNWVHTRIG